MNFLEPYDVLMLVEFVILAKRKQISITINPKPIIKEYLIAIGFIEFCNTNYAQPTTIDFIPKHTAMPIRRVEKHTMVEYITLTRQYLENLCRDKDLTMLDTCLAETINNVYDHSKTNIGAYVFCQFYPNNEQIKIAVSDSGIGIGESVRTCFRKLGKNDNISDHEALDWALTLKNTTQSQPHNQGRGLDTINSFVKSNQGSWTLWTGNVQRIGYADNTFYRMNEIDNFFGTTIQITINVKKLEVVDILNNIW